MGEELVIFGQPHTVGVDHHLADAPVIGGLDHFGQLRVDCRFAAAELDDFRVALNFDKAVEHGLHLLQGQVVSDAGVGEAHGAVEVAGGVHLDEAEANVLFVLRAEAAIQRATIFYLSAEIQGNGAGLVEADAADVHFGVRTDDALKPAVGGATLAHVDLVVANNDLGVDDGFALGADGAGQFVEDEIGFLLGIFSGGQRVALLIVGYP